MSLTSITRLTGTVRSTGRAFPVWQARAASALAFVTGSSREVQEAVAKEGAIEYLTSLLKPTAAHEVTAGRSLEARFEAAGALWSLSKHNDQTTANIAEAGAIASLVKLLHEADVDAQVRHPRDPPWAG